MSYTNIRLEKTDGTVIAYFAPNFEVRPILDNDLFANALPRGSPTIVRDLRKYQHEITLQGVFEHSNNLPSDHATALENLFGFSPVTARDQVRRVQRIALNTGGPFHFYDDPDQYTETDEANVDIANGIYPTVNLDQFRPPSQGGLDRQEYVVKLSVGVPS